MATRMMHIFFFPPPQPPPAGRPAAGTRTAEGSARPCPATCGAGTAGTSDSSLALNIFLQHFSS